MNETQANALEKLQTLIQSAFPDVQFRMYRPVLPTGEWSLDVRRENYLLVIDWREQDGFGLTADPDHGYGEGADEVYLDLPTAFRRAVLLVSEKLETVPPYQVRLKELRESLGLTQEEVARKMGVQQAAVSRLESREDSRVETLEKYASALGARLVLQMVFGARREEIALAPRN